jgi:sugar lactone lactonase YvrE
VGHRIGTVVPVQGENEALVALQNGVFLLNIETEALNPVVSPEKHLEENRFNDGKCDTAGRLWVGSMHLETKKGAAALYRINQNGSADKMLSDQTICNGIVWTSDKKTMYYIDTETSKIRAYDYDHDSGDIKNERVVVEVPEDMGKPDGMAIDEEDRLWVAHYGGACVGNWDPLSGRLLQKVDVPALNVTSCSFGGNDLKQLFITTAGMDMSEEDQKKYPDAGSLFVVETVVKGAKHYFFKKNF